MSCTTVLLVTAATFSLLLHGQTPDAPPSSSGSLKGTVFDQAGRRLPLAAILIRNAATGIQTLAHPGDQGDYRFDNLPGGKYSVRASARGLTTVQINDVTVQANKVSTIDVTLPEPKVSPISVVEVSEAPAPQENAALVPPPPPQPAAPMLYPPPPPQAFNPKAVQNEINGFRDRLALSAEQQIKIRAILEDRQQQILALRADNSLPPPARREKLQQIRADADAKFRALLTENQLDEYDEILRERRERREQIRQEQSMLNASH